VLLGRFNAAPSTPCSSPHPRLRALALTHHCLDAHSTPTPSAEPLHAVVAKSGWLGSVLCACRVLRRVRPVAGCPQSVRRKTSFLPRTLLRRRRLFCELGLRVDGYMMTAVVPASGQVADADLGMQAHGHVIGRYGVGCVLDQRARGHVCQVRACQPCRAGV
jgi:hypothetical protein